MAHVAIRPAGVVALVTAIAAVREHFARHFDRGWLAMIIDESPIDFTTLRQIRQLLATTDIYPEDIRSLRFGVEQLERFTQGVRRYLLPTLRERLGVSNLRETQYRLDPSERVHRQLLCLSFPINLARLEELTAELAGRLEATFPSQEPQRN